MAAIMSVSKLVERLNSTDAGKNMYLCVLSEKLLGLGTDPIRPSHVLDLSTEKVSPYDSAEVIRDQDQRANATPVHTANGPKMSRRSGEYWFEIKGRRVEGHSLKELLSSGLCAIEADQPGTLEKLSRIKPRSRRIVAHDPKQLFDKKHLADEYSERLLNGWWFGTNNSAHETRAWLERACSCADLRWGKDFKTSL